jgi:very-short-patch-repair endonuclease
MVVSTTSLRRMPFAISTLTEGGYRVLRFWNNDVLGNLEGVLITIQTELNG